uniref:hypothetical protein n=1 Tax=Escherichia coli TaxID=562 RepID=UPI001BFED168
FSDPGPVFHTIVSIKNDGHYFCRAGGNRPDGLNEPVTSAGCYVTVAVRGKQEFIIAELDSEIRKIRLKLTDSYEEGVRLSSGTFTLPARFCREILPDDVRSITIILEKSDDEWWYGSY